MIFAASCQSAPLIGCLEIIQHLRQHALGDREVLPKITRYVRESLEATHVDGDRFAEDAVDENVVLPGVLVLPVERHGDVPEGVWESACGRDCVLLVFCQDTDEIEKEP